LGDGQKGRDDARGIRENSRGAVTTKKNKISWVQGSVKDPGGNRAVYAKKREIKMRKVAQERFLGYLQAKITRAQSGRLRLKMKKKKKKSRLLQVSLRSKAPRLDKRKLD